MRSASRPIVFALAFGAVALACAPADVDAGDDANGADSTRRDAGVSPVDASRALDAASSVDAARDAAADGGGDADAGPLSCLPAAGCPGERNLGAVSGDTGAANLNATGTRSEWLHLRVTEDDSGVSGAALKVKLTLLSPPGENYDLFLYLAPSNQVATFECTTVRAKSLSTTTEDGIAVSWPDNQASGGQDDSKNITIEVRHVDGSCRGGTWSLLVQGNRL